MRASSARWSLAVMAALSSSPCAAAAAMRRYALVVAHNGSDQPGTPALKYADDDGYRWREALQRLGVQTTLLTVPDSDTARLESDRAPAAGPPTVAAVRAAVGLLGEQVRRDRAAGQTADALLVYVGHGQTTGSGQAYLTLTDGRLDQAGLYALVDGFGADYVHLIIDACHAGGVVGSRGADQALLDELKATLAQEQLKARPNVGALFAESEAGETHEWSRIRAGVFSHAARSGLLGAADVNNDGSIAYSELDAFVAAAIRGVKGGRSRLTLKTHAPALDVNRPLLGPVPAGPTLRVPEGRAFGRLSIEDTDGIRLADINRREGEVVSLALPPRAAYWLRSQAGEARVRAEDLARDGIALREAEVAERGGAQESYERGLFSIAFGRGFYEGYQASSDAPAVVFEAADGQGGPAGDEAGRLDGALLGVGVALGVSLNQAPLGLSGIAPGVSVSWRTSGWLYAGVRAQYVVATGVLEGATLHRPSAGALAGARGSTALAPFFEVEAHWAPLFAVRAGRPQGDWLAAGAQLAAGVAGSRTLLKGLRLAATLSIDAAQLDSQRRAVVMPGAELSVTF
ncbi:MAG: caspase family protein [Myxococcaceae bacterium]|nr:caspase family protein [Myxococcaceae bacterium]